MGNVGCSFFGAWPIWGTCASFTHTHRSVCVNSELSVLSEQQQHQAAGRVIFCSGSSLCYFLDRCSSSSSRQLLTLSGRRTPVPARRIGLLHSCWFSAVTTVLAAQRTNNSDPLSHLRNLYTEQFGATTAQHSCREKAAKRKQNWNQHRASVWWDNKNKPFSLSPRCFSDAL